MTKLIRRVQAWFEGKDWLTWVSHVFMATFLGLAATVVVMLPETPLHKGILLGVLGYWWREAEQVWNQYRTEGMDAVLAHAGDHFMDLASPFAAYVIWRSFGG